ncbi:hypothetical protein JRG66_10410 [Salinimicrobium tongyeongense]|jgi:hypothetical protein|uniref:Uncharacterized protein n=1 Tax=Salinimicrobium tongyeongense TaxID=2809707 RepID=A0ABY6NNF1_9FLAO|nr:hypothetical protein [Salinimicrobium tongyeongense]UZH54397.1 hypothetical protein JRG66_10410 [Salinimicrobium tongyeongense]
MNSEEKLGAKEVSTRFKKSRITHNEVQRKDWGYTDQYRRMMQRDSRKKAESNKEG